MSENTRSIWCLECDCLFVVSVEAIEIQCPNCSAIGEVTTGIDPIFNEEWYHVEWLN